MKATLFIPDTCAEVSKAPVPNERMVNTIPQTHFLPTLVGETPTASPEEDVWLFEDLRLEDKQPVAVRIISLG